MQVSDPLDPRAVLGTVKAQPSSMEARGRACPTASLDRPCARRVRSPQAGTKERPPGTNKGTAQIKELSMT